VTPGGKRMSKTILCMASYEKGHDFMREAKRQGCRVLLLTLHRIADRPWPYDSIDQIHLLTDFSNRTELFLFVAQLAWEDEIHRVVAMDDYDVETAAAVREHLRLDGLGDTDARFVRDKLAMRVRAQQIGIPAPEHVALFNWQRIAEFTRRVPPPWLLKPRSEAGTLGIKKLSDSDELWEALDELEETKSQYLIEQFVPGSVCHVDTIVHEGKILFEEAHEYQTTPLETAHGGGLFCSRTLVRDKEPARTLLALNRKWVGDLHFHSGITHTEFIKAQDGRVMFLETAARVGGANLADMIEAATGVNLWHEWARLEASDADHPYRVPQRRWDYGGILVSLARYEWPDTSSFEDPEIKWRLKMKNHIGLVVASPEFERVTQLLGNYTERFYEEFHAAVPQKRVRPI
jgi:biotin carboxylase